MNGEYVDAFCNVKKQTVQHSIFGQSVKCLNLVFFRIRNNAEMDTFNLIAYFMT